MDVLLLAAGFGTRLAGVTSTPKPLIEIDGRPVVDHILERLWRLYVGFEIGQIHLVTNAAYYEQFEEWARDTSVVVWNDGTTCVDERLGALGDIAFVADRAGLGETLVIAADQVFDFEIAEMLAYADSVPGSVIACTKVDPSLTHLYGVVMLDESGRIVDVEEKPERPKSDVIGTAIYVLTAEHLALLKDYLAEHEPDPLGGFFAWLIQREPVYGYVFDGSWIDIGSPETLASLTRPGQS